MECQGVSAVLRRPLLCEPDVPFPQRARFFHDGLMRVSPAKAAPQGLYRSSGFGRPGSVFSGPSRCWFSVRVRFPADRSPCSW